MDRVTRTISVELWVVVTTALLVARFLIDFFGPWYANRFKVGVVLTVEGLNYFLVHYTIGMMQLSAPAAAPARVNGFFQVWAVLLVTLQYSVKVGRPYSHSSSKKPPVLDLMSSLWAANLLRLQATSLLRAPLWIIWALNAARIVSYFCISDKAAAINQANIRLVSHYMSYDYEHTLAADPNDEFTMKWYRYLVLGEDLALKRKQKQGATYEIRLDPDQDWELVTLEEIWSVDAGDGDGQCGLLGAAGDPDNKLKDVCLSFALYKLLRRRFYDLPGEGGGVGKARRLVLEYITRSHERALRVAAVELSFLQDLFYSKHAEMFAGGFPTASLLLSLSLVAAVGYIADPARSIPGGVDKADRNTITHGVLVTRVIVGLIVGKELAEIYMYVFSHWAKVLVLCSYVRGRRGGVPRRPAVEAATRAALFFMSWGNMCHRGLMIHQHNLLVSPRWVTIALRQGFKFPTKIKLEECTSRAIVGSLSKLKESPKRLGSYEQLIQAAFGAKESLAQKLAATCHELVAEAETHKILVWHIATCLAEIHLNPRQAEAEWWEDYTTAASLSNYCAYLVTQALVPDNGIVVYRVFFEVLDEVHHVIWRGIRGSRCFPWSSPSAQHVYDSVMSTVDEVAEEDSDSGDNDDEHWKNQKKKKRRQQKSRRRRLDIPNSLTRKGAAVWAELLEAYGTPAVDRAGLWKDMAAFWSEFLLHLAAATRASKHKMRLNGSPELTTHLWALLSHAGFHRGTSHGEQLLDQLDLQDAADPIGLP